MIFLKMIGLLAFGLISAALAADELETQDNRITIHLVPHSHCDVGW